MIALAPGHDTRRARPLEGGRVRGISRRHRRLRRPERHDDLRATAVAGTNIALVKYWGKRDEALNLPATGSLSLTLDRPGHAHRASPSTAATARAIAVTLDGAPAAGQGRRAA